MRCTTSQLAHERTVRREAEAEVTRLSRFAAQDTSLLVEASAALRTTASLEEAHAQLARMTSISEDLARENASLRSRVAELEADVEKQRRSSAASRGVADRRARMIVRSRARCPPLVRTRSHLFARKRSHP